jgi:acyl-coenzyme A thioesterase PaaI-like protein
MRSTQDQPAPGHTTQIFRESAIAARAIARHQREATLQARPEEAREMEALHGGVCRMALEIIGPYQPVSDAA